MSMMGTLAKMAIGVAVAKGASSMLKGAQGNSGASGGLFGGQQQASSGGGLQDMLGSMLGGGQSGGGASGGLGGLLEGLAGGGSQSSGGGLDSLLGGQGGALGGIMESLTGGKAAAGGAAGGLGGLVGGLLGGAGGAQEKPGGSFGDLLNQALAGGGEPKVAPTQAQNAAAALMLRAMIQAAKSDGKIDQAERAKLLDNLGDVSPEERDFVQQEMQAPVDVAGLARQVPKGLEQQVYTMSVMAIDLDNQNEARYLDELARGMGIDQRNVNAIHQQLGVPALYA